MTRRTPLIALAILLACLVMAGLASVYRGQDANWDLLNYHLYDPWAFYHHGLTQDLFPAGIQSYLVPWLDLPYYLMSMKYLPHAPRLIAFLMGEFFGLMLFVSLVIAWIVTGALRSATLLERAVLSLLCIGFGVTGAATVSQVGTTFNEIQTALVTLLGLLALIHAATLPAASGRRMTLLIVVSGLLFGAAAGLKLTACIYDVAACMIAFALDGRLAQRLWRAILFFLAWLVSFAAITVPWDIQLYRHFGNPLFPFFNGVFHSDWIPLVDISDRRFLPHSVLQALFYPFYWIHSAGMMAIEPPFGDPRFAMALIAAIAWLAAWLFVSWRKRRFTLAKRGFGPIEALLLFFALSYPAWEALFSILRYAEALEALAGLFIVAVSAKICEILGRQANPRLLAGLIALLLLIAHWTTHYPDMGRERYSDQQYIVRLPDLPPHALMIFLGTPVAYLAPFFAERDPSDRFVGIITPVMQSLHLRLGEKIRGEIADWQGPEFFVATADTLDNSPVLAHFGVFPNGNCALAHSNISYADYVCPLSRKPTGLEWPHIGMVNYVNAGELQMTRQNDGGTGYLREGWSAPEAWGTWTVGPQATLAVHLLKPPSEPVDFAFMSHAFVSPAHPEMTVNVAVNGQQLASLHYQYPHDAPDRIRHIEIPAALAARERGILRVTFTIPNPVSPADIHYAADDHRALGMGLVWFRFTPENTAPPAAVKTTN